MKIQAGKRYLRADGGITGVIVDNKATESDFPFDDYPYRDDFPFLDGGFGGCSYTKEGAVYIDAPNRADLIAEVPEHLLEKLVRDILEFNRLNPVTPFEDMDNKEVKQRCTDYFNNNESIKDLQCDKDL